jgi:hypothetical protein
VPMVVAVAVSGVCVVRMSGVMGLAVKIVSHVCLPVVNLMSPSRSLPPARATGYCGTSIPYPLPYLEIGLNPGDRCRRSVAALHGAPGQRTAAV